MVGKKTLVIIIAVALTGFFLHGCGSTVAEASASSEITAEQGKKTVTVRVSLSTSYLNAAVKAYNKQSSDYEVELIQQNGLKFNEKLEVQLATGEAADLIENPMVNLDSLARKGAFLPLDDIISGYEEEYFDSALESGRVEGVQYMLPYQVSLHTYITSKDIAGDLTTWNIDEFMERIEASGVSYAEYIDPVLIVENFAINDVESKRYIDWETGESKLDEAPFIRLLEFAKKYGKVGGENISKAWEEGMIEGTIAGDGSNVSDAFAFMNKYDAYFKNNASYIGYPGDKRSSGYLWSTGFMINSKAENVAGAEDFLRWIISKEGQRTDLEASYKAGGVGSRTYCVLPARRDIFEEEFEDYQSEMAGFIHYYSPYKLFEYDCGPLTDEQADIFKRLIDEARPENTKVNPIMEIIDEEMGPFLDGSKSAEEVAKIMDSRVQIYLDELK